MQHNFLTNRERDSYGKSIHKEAHYAQNPHTAIMDFISPYLDGVDIYPNMLLIATYRRPEKVNGLYYTDNNLDEDMYQSAAGLVLKVGNAAFQETAEHTFCGFRVKATDWITFRPVNGSARAIAGLHCRFLEDRFVQAVIKDPTLIW